ncbi:dipeptidase [Natronosalvus rutilus]|uniref:Dipeptidase n=1 Tax=Natronosalvus rutilus TaxID=2953753 RepID=A0A9E7NE83_9EURY|nr:membrane dipeptidase [Natronosalvus rutilus]UTF55716.1 dipeptidase [Natronosalvus rutilus]
MTADYFELTEQERRHADILHEEVVVVDGLIATDAYLTDREYRSHLPRGGVDAANFTVGSYRDNFESTLQQITKIRGLTESIDACVVEEYGDIHKAIEETDTAIVMGFQDTKPIENDRWKLDLFADLGVRVIQLTYNEQNYIGAGCCEDEDTGLSSFGRDVVNHCNDRGVLIDLSHCGDRTTMDTIEYSADPVAFTHIGIRDLCDAPGRNKTTEQLEALSDAGGVAGITFFPPLIKREAGSHYVAESTVEDVLNHLDYAVDVMGVDHVGIGTDLDGRSLDREETPPTSALRHYRPNHPEVYGAGATDVYDPYPEGINRHTGLRTLTRGLVVRGYTDEEISKILGGNFLRLFEEVWAS